MVLRSVLNTLKDKASQSKAALLSPTASTAVTSPAAPDLVILRVTSHQPTPCHPKHITALLSFGRGSRLCASTVISSLASRLRSTRDPSVALKCLLAVHYIVLHGSFILQDQLLSFLRPPLGGRNPLNLSTFPSPHVRWYARVLELLLSSHRTLGAFPRHGAVEDPEPMVSRTNADLLAELDKLVSIQEEIGREPFAEWSAVVREVRRMVEEESVAVRGEIVLRVREMGERVGDLTFGEAVELGCLVGKVEACCGSMGLTEVRERVERRAMEKSAAVRRRERVGESSRRVGVGFGADVRFPSTRWGVVDPTAWRR